MRALVVVALVLALGVAASIALLRPQPVELGTAAPVALGGPERSEEEQVVPGAPREREVAAGARRVLLRGVLRGAGELQEGALVQAIPEGRGFQEGIATAEVDAGGRFELELVGGGPHVLVLLQRHGGELTFRVDVPDAAAHEVELTLPRGRIAGVLRGLGGEPLANARVRVARDRWQGALDPLVRSDVRTDADGGFAFEDLPADTYLVRAHGTRALGDLRLFAGAALEGLELRVEEAGAIVGRVLDVQGAPVEGAAVFAFDAGGRWLPGRVSALSDAAGEFEYEPLPPGTWRIAARDAAHACSSGVAARLAADEAAEVELRLAPAARLEAVLLDAEGRELPALWRVLDAQGCNHAGLIASNELEQVIEEGVTPTVARFGPLAPGSWRVEARAPSGHSARADVELEAGSPQRVELRLAR